MNKRTKKRTNKRANERPNNDCKIDNKVNQRQLRFLEDKCQTLNNEINNLKKINKVIQSELSALKSSSSVNTVLHSQSSPQTVPIPPTGKSGVIQPTTSSALPAVALPPQSATSNIQSILKSVHLDLMNKNKKKSKCRHLRSHFIGPTQ